MQPAPKLVVPVFGFDELVSFLFRFDKTTFCVSQLLVFVLLVHLANKILVNCFCCKEECRVITTYKLVPITADIIHISVGLMFYCVHE